MMGTHCKDCEHFIFWRDNNNSFDSEPEGVCTAPRPQLGPAPNREVRKYDGVNCPAASTLAALVEIEGEKP